MANFALCKFQFGKITALADHSNQEKSKISQKNIIQKSQKYLKGSKNIKSKFPRWLLYTQALRMNCRKVARE